MDNTIIVNILNELIKVDIDAVHTYEQALINLVDDPNIHDTMDTFKNDHLQHIQDLSMFVRQYGGAPAERPAAFEGFSNTTFTEVSSMAGLGGALVAMEHNEKVTTKAYFSVIQNNRNLPPAIMDIVTKNYNDERNHLAYIQQVLTTVGVSIPETV